MTREQFLGASNLVRRSIQREKMREKEHTLTPTPTPPKPNQKATIPVRGIKVAVPLPPGSIPPDIVPPEGLPAGEPVLEVPLEDGSVVVVARLNGKSLRRTLKTVAEHGAENVVLVLQGNLRTGCAADGGFVLSDAGLQVTVKTPKVEGQEGGVK